MMAKSHVVVGLATWITAAPLLHIYPLNPVYLGLAVAGSLLPDIDHPRSWVGRRMGPVSTALASILGHRGLTHSAIAVFSLAMWLSQAGYQRGGISALIVGYLSHLAADMLTPQGLRLAWPLRGTWALPICRTGSPLESIIVFALVCVIGWWIFRHGLGGLPALPRKISNLPA